MTDSLNQKILAVMRSVGYVQKTKGGNVPYAAVRHDNVVRQIRPALLEYGILIIPPSVVESRMVPKGTQTKGGTPIMRYEGTFEVGLVNADDPADKQISRIDAHADDEGDKAPGKAVSYALKTYLLKAFYLETGEDDEARIEEVKAHTRGYTDEQHEIFTDRLNAESDREFAAFMATLDHDTQTALFNSFPKGMKVKEKQRVREKEEAGFHSLSALLENLAGAASTDDVEMAQQCRAEMDDWTARWVKKNAPQEVTQFLIEIAAKRAAA